MPERSQVVIVGGGPVGVGLAVELVQRGARWNIFYYRHCVPRAIMLEDVPTSSVNVYGNLMSDFWSAPQQREQVQQYYFQAHDRLPQYCVGAVLFEPHYEGSPIIARPADANPICLDTHPDAAASIRGVEQ